MRWQGIPVSLWCSKPVASSMASAAPIQDPPSNPQDPPSNPYASKNPDPLYAHLPQSFFFPRQMYYPFYSAAVPETASTMKQPEMPPFQQFPHIYSPLYPYSYPQVPTTTVAPMTTTAKPETFSPPEFILPGYTPAIPPFLWPFTVPMPAGAQTTTNPQSPQLTPYMHFLSHYPLYHQFVPLPQFPSSPNAEMVTGSGSTDIVLPQHFAPFPPFVPQYPSNPNPGLETGNMDTVLPQVQSHNFPYFQPQSPVFPNPSLSS